MAFENKKQVLIIAAAVVACIVAVLLTSNYIENNIKTQTATLAETYEARQKETVTQLQQKSEQQMAALAQELERVKTEQGEALQKQMALMKGQQEQAQQQAKQQAEAAAAPKVVRKPSLAVKTPPGKRAITVMINSLSAVGGLLNAGDFVDVIAHLETPDQNSDKKKTVTAMVFQGLEVLAVNTNLNDPGAYDDQQAAESLKITFAVNPQEAGLLSFAGKNGKLELALRSPDERDHQMVKASTWKTLADYVLENQGSDIQNPDEIKEEEEKPVETKPYIQIFRGGKEL